MKRLIACLAFSFSLIAPDTVAAQTDWDQWEAAYTQLINKSERRALSMLQERYTATSDTYEKLYISSRLYEFLSIRNQPYHGNSVAGNNDFSRLEQQFIGALNAEGKLDFESAKNTHVSLLKQANQLNDVDGKILFEYHLCRMLNSQGHYFQASPYCNSLNTHISDSSSSLIPPYLALRVIANNFEFIGNYQAALEMYQQYLNVIPSYVDPSGVYNDAGLLLKTLGNTELAKEYLTTAITLRQNQGLALAQSHHSMGDILLDAKEYTSALEHFAKSKTILEQYQHSYGLTYVLVGLGETHIEMQQIEQGIALLLQALETAVVNENLNLQGDIYLALASAHIKQNKYSSANRYAKDALDLADTIASERLIAQSLKTLATISERQGNFEQALNYYQHYFSSEINKRSENHQVAFLALDSARQNFSQQVEFEALLAEKNSLKEQIEKSTSLTHLYQVFIALLISFIGLFFYQKRKEIRHAEVDSLTGALNRAASIREIKQQPKLNTQETKYVVILMDLDDFKKINDNYGHPTGDRALTHVAKIIAEHILPTDIFGRLGGEEFAIVMKEIDELEIVERVSRLHSAIGNTPFSAENKEKLYVTASFSYLATSKSLADFDELYSILDQALYQAKQNGKNRVIDAYNEPIYLSTTTYSAKCS